MYILNFKGCTFRENRHYHDRLDDLFNRLGQSKEEWISQIYEKNSVKHI